MMDFLTVIPLMELSNRTIINSFWDTIWLSNSMLISSSRKYKPSLRLPLPIIFPVSCSWNIQPCGRNDPKYFQALLWLYYLQTASFEKMMGHIGFKIDPEKNQRDRVFPGYGWKSPLAILTYPIMWNKVREVCETLSRDLWLLNLWSWSSNWLYLGH